MGRRAIDRWFLGSAAAGVCICAGVFLLSGCPANQPPPPEGRYIDVGGYYLFFIEQGEQTRLDNGQLTPTVIFISGLADNLLVWDKVQAEAAAVARTVSYDRGGVGWSDEGTNPRTGGRIAQELRTMLDLAGIPGPYLLVAHSFGGLFARLFANAYADDVVGVVLIDTVHEDRESRQALLLPPRSLEAVQTKEGIVTGYLTTQYGTLGEYQNRINTYAEIRAKRRLLDIPLILLGRDAKEFDYLSADATRAYQLEYELDLSQATLVPRGEYRIISGTGHVIQQDRPDAVVTAILDVMNRPAGNEVAQ